MNIFLTGTFSLGMGIFLKYFIRIFGLIKIEYSFIYMTFNEKDNIF